MKKFASISLLAATITFGLFVFMAYLISSDKVTITELPGDIPINVVSLPDEKPPTVKPPTILKPPVVQPPIPMTTELPEVKGGVGTLVYNPPQITLSGGSVKGLSLGGNRNDDARPIVRISPKYPLNAIRNGIEGWVMLAFTINSIGEVENVSVVNSQPKRVFDKAARQALKKWKYRAKKVNGKAVEQRNLTVQLDFKMGQSS